MDWNYEGQPTEAGWHAVLICYDEQEGIFPDARFWNGETWCSREYGDETSHDRKGVLAFGDKCESKDDAKRLAYEYDIGG